MFSKIFSTIVFSVFVISANAQSPIIFTYGSDAVSRSEFERVYMKNNPKGQMPDNKSIDEYLDLYINFKLKVKEATMLGMDTAEAYRKELAGYRKQLAQPYLSDKNVTEKLIKEAYDRSRIEVKASHILVFLDEYALPKDTLAAYGKIMKIRNEITIGGESFDSVATRSSEDPSAKFNNGDLGYFTAFNLIYSFESMAYNSTIGDVSLPFRTRFGYHILKVTDKRAARPDLKIAHIMLKTSTDAIASQQVKSKIDSLFNRINMGGSFEELCKKFSQDEGTATKGGVLNIIQSLDTRWPPDFKEAAYSLKKEGDASTPIKTNYGWHILKLIEIKPIQDYENKKEELRMRVNKDMRSEMNKESVIERIKKENGFKEKPANLKKYYNVVDSSILAGKWKGNAKNKMMKKPLFKLGDKNLTGLDFANYISDYQTPRTNAGIIPVVNSYYAEFVKQSVLGFEEEHLEGKNDTFKNLFKEYHDGILLFELNDKKVWSKATTDTLGLKNFYEQNNANYQWKDRADAALIDCDNNATATAVTKMIASGRAADEIQKELNEKNALAVGLKESKFEKGENSLLDSLGWKKGVNSYNFPDGHITIVWIKDIIPAGPKKLQEAKGIITADYQTYLDKEWIKELREKYPVKVDQAIKTALFSK